MKHKIKTKLNIEVEYKKYKPALKYYIKNVIITFVFMMLIVAVAIAGVLWFMGSKDNNNAVYTIFFNNIPTVALSGAILSVFFTILETTFNKILIGGLIKDFSKATNKVLQGDYSTRINIDNIKFSNVQLIILAENFNEMVKGLSKVESLSNDFISNVSHEFKTPLSVIQSYATIIQNPSVTNEEKKYYLDKIIESTQQLTSLVTNVLKLNKIENNQVSVNKARYNLSSQLTQCLLDFEDVWDKKNIVIDFDVSDDVMVYSDESLLNMVWNNLISNAIKFTPNGGTVGVKLSENDNWILVEISDSGCGMDEETAAHIFEKFYQGDTSHSEKGNGLGLALVKRILTMTGDNITVFSKPNEGATFKVAIKK